ncbi:MAG: hypothetical protein Q8S31_00595 [Alphaproteobacteria bacterium]|nr:hypothetical protein [Alphaproteobacteria bacterium]
MTKPMKNTKRSKKNIAIGLGIFALAILFYVITVTRLGGFR